MYVTRIESADLAALRPSGSEAATLPAGAIPCAIAVDAATGKLYVANYGDGTVAVVDAQTRRIAATVPVGDHPKAIAFDLVRKLVYVANSGGNSITIVDAGSNSVVATLPAGKNPYALAVVPGSDRLYVANESDTQPSTVVDLSGIRPPNL